MSAETPVIWTVDLWFDREVHAGPLGFTKFYPCCFAVAGDEAEAIAKAKAHFRKKYDLGIVKANAKVAYQQDRNRYAFPEQIL